MDLIKLVFGLVFLFLGWIYFYNPNLVLVINRIIREHLFGDKQILLARKKLGILYFIISSILLYMGITSIARTLETIDKNTWVFNKQKYIMYLAAQDYYAGRYERAIERYEILLKNEGNASKIFKNIASAYISLGNMQKARIYLEKLAAIAPNDQGIKQKLEQINRKQNENNNRKN